MSHTDNCDRGRPYRPSKLHGRRFLQIGIAVMQCMIGGCADHKKMPARTASDAAITDDSQVRTAGQTNGHEETSRKAQQAVDLEIRGEDVKMFAGILGKAVEAAVEAEVADIAGGEQSIIDLISAIDSAAPNEAVNCSCCWMVIVADSTLAKSRPEAIVRSNSTGGLFLLKVLPSSSGRKRAWTALISKGENSRWVNEWDMEFECGDDDSGKWRPVQQE